MSCFFIRILSASFLPLFPLLACGGTVRHAPNPGAEITYEIRLEFVANKLADFDITLSLHSAKVRCWNLQLPQGTRRMQILESLNVSGGTIAARQTSDLVRVCASGLRTTLRYRLLADASLDTAASSQDSVIRQSWFAFNGEDLFLIPHDPEKTSVRVAYDPLPASWTTMLPQDGMFSLSHLKDTLFLGGSNYSESKETSDGVVVSLFYPAELAGEAQVILARAGKIVETERAFWDGTQKNFAIGLVRLSDTGDFSGRGFYGGFGLYLGQEVAEHDWVRLIAHENLHTWISRGIGGFPKRDPDSEAWLNEGFTEAYTARILLSCGLWSPAEYIDDWNAALARYGTSPDKTAPNELISRDRQHDFDVNKLPYDRGRILAVLWDDELRAATGGRVGMTKVLKEQIRQARTNEANGDAVSADLLLPQMVKRLSGLDLRAEETEYVDRGQALTLPANSFGPCLQVTERTQPIFDRGFDLLKTMTNGGHVADLEPDGPAEKAGLRSGDSILIDEIPSHDSRTTLTYIVREPQGRQHVIKYQPEGYTQVRFQELSLSPFALVHRSDCSSSMIRP